LLYQILNGKGFENFVLSFFTTCGSVSGRQVTVLKSWLSVVSQIRRVCTLCWLCCAVTMTSGLGCSLMHHVIKVDVSRT